MKRAVALAIVLALALVATAAAIDAQNVKPAPGPHNLLSLFTSTPLAHTQFALGIVGNYAAEPIQLTLAKSGTDLAVVDRVTSGHFFVGLGLFDRVELTAGGAYYNTSGADMDQIAVKGFSETDFTGGGVVGDTMAALKVNILPNEPGWVGLAVVGQGTFATGDEEIYAGHGDMTFSGALVVDKRFGPVNLVGNGGYRYLGSPEDLEPAGEVFFGGGVDVAVATWLGLTGEIVGKTQDLGIDAIDAATPVEVLLGPRWFTPIGLDFVTAVGFGVTDGVGSPAYRGIVGMTFAYPRIEYGPPKREPRAPVSIVPIDDPNADTDRDGLSNREEKQTYKTDPAKPDTDGDGLTDGEEVKEFGTDPLVADTDGDGLSDAAELRVYSTNARKVDTDSDGLTDGQEVNELRTNPTAMDTDGDKVPDGQDGAPLEAETINGFLDHDGVPEVLLVKKASGLMLFENQLVPSAPLTFRGEKSTKLTKADKQTLDEVAQLLAEFPKLKLQVEGHVAAGIANAEQISTARADVVRNHLIGRGVAADRLGSAGMGDSVPITSNDTPEGRATNTRIDFVITER
jgi:outer membrane protein OmpA-like peptidoglycan-associated protein